MKKQKLFRSKFILKNGNKKPNFNWTIFYSNLEKLCKIFIHLKNSNSTKVFIIYSTLQQNINKRKNFIKKLFQASYKSAEIFMYQLFPLEKKNDLRCRKKINIKWINFHNQNYMLSPSTIQFQYEIQKKKMQNFCQFMMHMVNVMLKIMIDDNLNCWKLCKSLFACTK